MSKPLGVVPVRFQTPSLTEAHRYLLSQVATRSSRVLVLLGTAAVPLTKRNPLEVSLRMRMVQDFWLEEYPDGPELIVVPMHDRQQDTDWSKQIDQLIAAVNINGPAVVYCGPDGAGPFYQSAGGRWPVEVLDYAGTHASKIRAEIIPRHTEDFRAGVIYAIERKIHGPFMTVDAIIREPTDGAVLLAHKREDGLKLRLVGGFVDLSDTSLEKAAQREIREETGLEVSEPIYIGSCPVNDWRYRGGPEKIMTALLAVDRVFGVPAAKDDIDGLEWCRPGEVAGKIHPVHLPLWELYLAKVHD